MNVTTQPHNGATYPARPVNGSAPHATSPLFRWAVRQFRQPQGFWGAVAGWIMATRPSNLERNRWTVELLEVQPADWVLEIGFGPGVALGWLAERASQGVVVGIDHSELMLRHAARRNAEAVRAGRITLQLGSTETLPDLGTAFDKIMAVNVALFWRDPETQLGELRERLRPGGRIALTLQPRTRGATDADTRRLGEALLQQVRNVGFREARLELRPMQPVAAACVLGLR